MTKTATAIAVPGPRRVDVPGSDSGIDLKTMGGRIAWARLRKKMTQAELGKKTEKSRATIVQYEQNNIHPPVAEVQKVADALDVSPEFIAFGRHGIDAVFNAAVEVVTVPEITEGKDGIFTSGGFAVPQKLFEDRKIDPSKVRMVVLNHDAPAFGYRAGDRIMVDSSVTTLSQGYNLYLVKVDKQLGVIRRELSFSGAKGEVTITSGNGSSHQVKEKTLDIVGAVVGQFSLSA